MGIVSGLKELYIRFLVWLGAEPPAGYEHLLGEQLGSREHTLQAGETLYSVARRYGVHYDRIAQANGVDSPENLQSGQTLIIPPADWDPASGPLAQLQPGSTPEAEPTASSVESTPDVAEPPAVVIPDEPVSSPEPIPFPEPDFSPSESEPEPQPAGDPLLAELVSEVETIEEQPASEPFAASEWPAGREETVSSPTQMELAIEPSAEPDQPAPPLEGPVEPVEKPAEVEAAPDTAFRYTVQRGDTLNAIARRYSLTVKDLVEANDIHDPNRIFPGQKLIIPGYPSPEPAAEPAPEPVPQPPPSGDHLVYTVAEGDTISGIAKRYGITVWQLIEANDLADPNSIAVGEQIIIPGVAQVRPPVQPEPQPQVVVQPEPEPEKPRAMRIDPTFPPIGPLDAIRAFYISYFAIGHIDFRQRIFELLDTTELNAVVIDAKGDHGWISYPTQIPLAQEIGAARPSARDFETLMAELKRRDIYTIARVVTFKDNPLARSYPEYAIKAGGVAGGLEFWQDRDKSGWADPFLKPVWDYNVQVAVEAAQMGFDEIQFDYVRFPMPGQAGTPQFSQEVNKETRIAAVTGFLSIARGQLQPFGVKVAADTFGYTCWRKDDTLIGQDIERLSQYLDVLSPMLYPSTFSSGIPRYKNAIAHPYEVVYESARRAVDRVASFDCVVRPWIQDFPDYRFDKRVYGREEIQAQIKGCFDAGSSGFIVSHPRGKYTAGAYAPVTGRP